MKITCSICLEALNFSLEEISVTICGHIFHRSCLEQWNRQSPSLRLSSSCPVCRKVINKRSTVKKLFPNVNEEQDLNELMLTTLQQLNLNFQTSVSSYEAEKLRLQSELAKSEKDRVGLLREVNYLRTKISKTKTADKFCQSEIVHDDLISKKN